MASTAVSPGLPNERRDGAFASWGVRVLPGKRMGGAGQAQDAARLYPIGRPARTAAPQPS